MIAIFIGIGVQLKSAGTFTPAIGCRFHVPCRFWVLGIVALLVLFRTALLRLNHSRIDNIDRALSNNKETSRFSVCNKFLNRQIVE